MSAIAFRSTFVRLWRGKSKRVNKSKKLVRSFADRKRSFLVSELKDKNTKFSLLMEIEKIETEKIS